MSGLGVVELALLLLVLPFLALLVLYWVVRLAVRHGSLDAHRAWEAERVRGELGLGAERSPNSR
jgi:hypothetical protein